MKNRMRRAVLASLIAVLATIGLVAATATPAQAYNSSRITQRWGGSCIGVISTWNPYNMHYDKFVCPGQTVYGDGYYVGAGWHVDETRWSSGFGFPWWTDVTRYGPGYFRATSGTIRLDAWPNSGSGSWSAAR